MYLQFIKRFPKEIGESYGNIMIIWSLEGAVHVGRQMKEV